MEKIEFSSNVEFVAKAKALLEDPEGYPYGYNKSDGECEYRTEDGRRCIAGRMFFGYVPEDRFFWNASQYIESLADGSGLRVKFPFLDFGVVKKIQRRHDYAAQNMDQDTSWEQIEADAVAADQVHRDTT